MIWTVAILLTGIGLLLVIPWSFQMDGAFGDDALWAKAEAQWGLGLASLRLRSDSGARLSIAGVPIARVTKLPERKPTKRAATRRRYRLSWARHADHRILCGMLRRAVAALHLRLYVRGTLGLEDPSHTGWALATARQLNAAAGGRVNVDLRDNFLDETSQLFGRVRAWVLPAEIVWVVVGWFVHPDTRRVLHGK